MQTDEWKGTVWKCLVQRQRGVLEKICTMTDPYYGKCEGRHSCREKVHSKEALSGIGEGEETGESDFVRERSEVEAEQNSCEPVCREELHLMPCDWEQYLKLRHQAENQYHLVDSIPVLRVGMVRGDEHTQIIGGLCRLIGRVRIDGRRAKALYRSSVKVRSIDAAIRLGGSAKSSGLSSSASERGTG